MKTLRIHRGNCQGSQVEYRFFENSVNMSLFWFSLHLESQSCQINVDDTAQVNESRSSHSRKRVMCSQKSDV